MDNFNGTVLGSRQGSIAWRFRSTKTLDGIDQSPSCWSMVFLRSGILGIRLSAANSVSYEALWIHWQSIQPRLVRFCDITWSWITWLENFYEAYCYYFGCGCLYSRYWSKRFRKLNDSLIMSQKRESKSWHHISEFWSSRKPVFWFVRNLAALHFWHFCWIRRSYWLIMAIFNTMVSALGFFWLLYV